MKNENEKNESKGEFNIIRRKRGKFTIRSKKIKKKTLGKYNLKKLEDDKFEIIKESENENNDKIKLEKRIGKFYDKIKKLKRREINISDYEEELSELMMEQIDKINYEEDKTKELRILNFFKHFQTNRKNEFFGKNYVRKRLTFNSPINFKSYKNINSITSIND